jgi:hypothetical protein
MFSQGDAKGLTVADRSEIATGTIYPRQELRIKTVVRYSDGERKPPIPDLPTRLFITNNMKSALSPNRYCCLRRGCNANGEGGIALKTCLTEDITRSRKIVL